MTKQTILKQYTRIGLCLPVILPALLFGFAYLAQLTYPGLLDLIPAWLLQAGLILIGSLFIGGIPYVIYFLYAWRFTRIHPGKPTYIFLLVSPAIFYVIQFFGLLLFQLGTSYFENSTFHFWSAIKTHGLLSLMVFPVAYCYIVLILLAYHIRIRAPRRPHQTPGG